MFTELEEVTYRKITAVHYYEKGKYMIWYHIEKKPEKTLGILEVRGLKQPLTKDELKKHIDKRWEEYSLMKKRR